jgi:hypothetical protein
VYTGTQTTRRLSRYPRRPSVVTHFSGVQKNKEGLYIVAYNSAYRWLVVWDWVWICDIQIPDSQKLKFSDL